MMRLLTVMVVVAGVAMLTSVASGCAGAARSNVETVSEESGGELRGEADATEDLGAVCADVVFSSVPPNLDEFPALDDESVKVLVEGLVVPTPDPDAAVDSPSSGYAWSVASESEAELVLFGQSERGGLASAALQRRDGAWQPMSFGGCTIDIGRSGQGPADVTDRAVDPTDEPLVLDESGEVVVTPTAVPTP